MKKFFCFLTIFALVFSISTTVFAERSKEVEFKDLINWAENRGFRIDGDISSVDYDSLDLNKLKRDLEAVSSLGKELNFEESNYLQKENLNNLSIKPTIGTRVWDEKIVPMLVKKTYSGTKDVDGEDYNFKVYVYIDYNCLVSRVNGEVLGIDSINSVTSDGGQASFIRDYEHDSGTEVWEISSKRAKVRGQGVFKVGIGDNFSLNWRIIFKVSFKAGEGKAI
ncbi:hypothetical protein [Clostridiisalibacter paucivorans]|uniref:hypothetical protein n=1 Tax=Clostridiisalibacter paucivorans TaxID=408753 RepID=UPI000479F145|nr:hypothetical protein [Clostridiisalibacter paucivorans]